MESLERMVAGLDRNIFDPWVVFHRVKDQSVVDRLEAMQVPVTSLSKPQPRNSNVASMNVSGWLAESDRRQKLLGVYKLAKSTREFVSRDTKWLNPHRHAAEFRARLPQRMGSAAARLRLVRRLHQEVRRPGAAQH